MQCQQDSCDLGTSEDTGLVACSIFTIAIRNIGICLTGSRVSLGRILTPDGSESHERERERGGLCFSLFPRAAVRMRESPFPASCVTVHLACVPFTENTGCKALQAAATAQESPSQDTNGKELCCGTKIFIFFSASFQAWILSHFLCKNNRKRHQNW